MNAVPPVPPTADGFRAELARVGLTQSGFGRLLARHRPDVPETIARQVRRWATGEQPPPAECLLALSLMPTAQGAGAGAEGSSTAGADPDGRRASSCSEV